MLQKTYYLYEINFLHIRFNVTRLRVYYEKPTNPRSRRKDSSATANRVVDDYNDKHKNNNSPKLFRVLNSIIRIPMESSQRWMRQFSSRQVYAL